MKNEKENKIKNNFEPVIENRLKNFQKEYANVSMSDEALQAMKLRMKDGKEEKYTMEKKKTYKKWTTAIAAAAALTLVVLPNTSSTMASAMGDIPVLGKFFQVVTFRDFQYEDDRHAADVKVPEIVLDHKTDDSITETTKASTEEINAEIKKLTDQWIREFKSNLEGEGYQDIFIDSEVINTSETYFTLKLICYQGAGSGYEEHHYYTIDLNTGKRVQLSNLFLDGSDYKSVISENIKVQMKEQMAADSGILYWVDYEELPELSFTEIKDDASFYINADGQIVICFNEGEVAPMYMGVVEFTIPDEVVADLLK